MNNHNEEPNSIIPFRVQRKNQKGWKMPDNTVYVGKGSTWENPFRVIQYYDKKWAIKTNGTKETGDILVKYCHAVYDDKKDATMDAIMCFEIFLFPYKNMDYSINSFIKSMAVLDLLETIKGKNLACWCNLNENCHADSLLKLANDPYYYKNSVFVDKNK